ncbi:MAG: DUF3037 domain-containing protein [Deltaproteobacteria bacterium]|nr:DUF3037 domain-containing protein [Nannocystaceae bacterium]
MPRLGSSRRPCVRAAVFEYVIVRVVPRIERDEFVNVGVVVYAPTRAFLDCRVELDRARLHALDPVADAEAIDCHLQAFATVCRGGPGGGPIAAMPLRERYHWLVAPRSATLQTSPVHGGRAEDLAAALDRLFESLVRRPV